MENQAEAVDVAGKVEISEFYCPSCGADLAKSIRFAYIVEEAGSIIMVDGQPRVVPKKFPFQNQTGNHIVHRVNCARCGHSVSDLIRNRKFYISSVEEPPLDDESDQESSFDFLTKNKH
ncbi:MAG: hypothetical protein Q7S53_04090 [bacterium]|nr:hypothetical protein [bacterium]